MSNPGVLYLNTKKLSNGVGLRVEDNIGEAIHIHYGPEWRIDLSVKQLLELDDIADNCLDQLLGHTGFQTKNFDPIFLDMISQDLIKLESVSIGSIKLEELEVETKNLLKLPVIRPLKNSRVFKALNGNTEELKNQKQENYREQSNLDRAEGMINYLKEIEYPFNNQYIVLFNNQNIIRDGQHRAACLLYLKGNIEIPIIRMIFHDNCNNTSRHPWVHYIFYWDKRRIKSAIKIMYKNMRKLLSKVYHLIKR